MLFVFISLVCLSLRKADQILLISFILSQIWILLELQILGIWVVKLEGAEFEVLGEGSPK